MEKKIRARLDTSANTSLAPAQTMILHLQGDEVQGSLNLLDDGHHPIWYKEHSSVNGFEVELLCVVQKPLPLLPMTKLAGPSMVVTQ